MDHAKDPPTGHGHYPGKGKHETPIIYGPIGFDPADPINAGVLADDQAGYSNAVLRRIHYRDPATGKELVFVTTCTHLRPGLIALFVLPALENREGLRCLQEQAQDEEGLGRR